MTSTINEHLTVEDPIYDQHAIYEPHFDDILDKYMIPDIKNIIKDYYYDKCYECKSVVYTKDNERTDGRYTCFSCVLHLKYRTCIACCKIFSQNEAKVCNKCFGKCLVLCPKCP